MFLRFTISPDVLETNVFSGDLRTAVKNSLDSVFYGEPNGLCVGEYSGSVMIRLSDIEKNPEGVRGSLIPSKFIKPSYDFPIYDETGKLGDYLVYSFPSDIPPSCVLDCLVASAKSYGRAVEEAFAHGEYLKELNSEFAMTYQIVSAKTMKVVSRTVYDPNHPETSWNWQG